MDIKRQCQTLIFNFLFIYNNLPKTLGYSLRSFELLQMTRLEGQSDQLLLTNSNSSIILERERESTEAIKGTRMTIILVFLSQPH